MNGDGRLRRAHQQVAELAECQGAITGGEMPQYALFHRQRGQPISPGQPLPEPCQATLPLGRVALTLRQRTARLDDRPGGQREASDIVYRQPFHSQVFDLLGLGRYHNAQTADLFVPDGKRVAARYREATLITRANPG